jgi:hypothetical protein
VGYGVYLEVLLASTDVSDFLGHECMTVNDIFHEMKITFTLDREGRVMIYFPGATNFEKEYSHTG